MAVVVRSLVIVLAVRTAHLLPPRVGYAAADLLGRIRAMLPSGRRELRRLRVAFPERTDHARLVSARAAIATRNHVSAARLLGSDVPADLRRHRRVCSPATAELLDGAASFVLAAAHMALELYLPFADRPALDRDVLFLVGTGIEPGQHTREQRAHRRAVDAYNRSIAERGGRLVELGDLAAVRSAVRTLRRPGHAAMVLADADADADDPASLTRPFAGRASASFATGPAQLARLAGVPIVVCTPHREGGDVVFEWSDPIAPPTARSEEESVADRVLDLLEQGVGRFPDQYGLPIGGSRRWIGGAWVSPERATR